MKKVISVILAALMLLAVCGCGKSDKTGMKMLESNNIQQSNADLIGSWGSYDQVQTVFNEDGTASFYKANCVSYTFTGKSLILNTDAGMTFTIDARLFGDDLIVFDQPYTFLHYNAVANKLDSGKWVCEIDDETQYTFEFADGKFAEDGKYTGTYYTEDNEMLMIYDECEDYKEGDYYYYLFNIVDDQLNLYYGMPLTRMTGDAAVSSADAA